MSGWALWREITTDKPIAWRTVLTAAGVLGVFLSALAFVQFATDALVGTDGYYHTKMGWLIRQEGLTPAFNYLPLTILNSADYYNHHLLYHVYLALFAAGDPALDGGAALVTGGKIASIVMPSLAFLAIWWLLRRQQVPFAALWSIGLLAVSEAFLYRMSMPRAQSASLLILVLALHWMLTGRHRLLLPLGFAYVWFYNAFPLLILVTGTYLIAEAITNRRLVWQPLAFAAAGVGLGILINPYFPENVTFMINHMLPKIGESAVRVGNEWRPYETWTLVRNSGPALALFLITVFLMGFRQRKWDAASLTAFGLTAVFGLMLFKSRRFIEYFPAFVLIFAALTAAPFLQQALKRWTRAAYAVPLLMAAALLFPLYLTLNQAADSVASSQPADKYRAAARWLDDRTEGTVRVFQTDWDDFTRLFFYNTNAEYTVGLDPTYLQLADRDLYDTWVDITRGRVERPAAVIRERFGGEYVFSDLDHEAFMAEAEADPDLVEIYRDDYAVIYRVLTPAGP